MHLPSRTHHSLLGPDDFVQPGDIFRLSWMEPDEFVACDLFVGHRVGDLQKVATGKLEILRPCHP